jgi:hypothetical protein
MTKGRLRYIPREVDEFILDIMRQENIPNISEAMKRTKEDAMLGREVRKIAKPFGWSFRKK